MKKEYMNIGSRFTTPDGEAVIKAWNGSIADVVESVYNTDGEVVEVRERRLLPAEIGLLMREVDGIARKVHIE